MGAELQCQRVVGVCIAGNIDVGTSHAIHTPGKDGIELRGFRVLHTLVVQCRLQHAVADGDVWDTLEEI